MSPIFLSYARTDNDRDEHDANQGWIRYFHGRLRLLLRWKLGQPQFDFWRDVQEIDKREAWHEPIKAALKEAKLLLAVLSPSFFTSENCQFELNHFLDCRKGDEPDLVKAAVIKVVKHQIENSILPAAIREPEGFKFFINDPEKGELSYYTPATGLRKDRELEFVDELERLANSLATSLKEIGEVVTKPPIATVFLAVPYPGSALGELYQRIKTELQRRDVKVVPDRKRFFAELDEPDPILLEQSVTNARLAVHLLDPTAGREAMALDGRQIDATSMRAKDATRLRRFIWVQNKPEGIADNELVASLRRLEANGGRLIDGDKLVEDSSERFIKLLIRTLFPNDPVSNASADTPAYYLLVHPDDDAAARKFALPTLRSRGLRCRMPVPATLGSPDRAAIYWGGKDAGWVFREIDRLKNAGAIILVKGPPVSEEKTAFLSDEVAETIDLTTASTPGAAA